MAKNEGMLIAGAIIVAVLLMGNFGQMDEEDEEGIDITKGEEESDSLFFGLFERRAENKPATIEVSCEAELMRKGYDNESATQLCEVSARNK